MSMKGASIPQGEELDRAIAKSETPDMINYAVHDAYQTPVGQAYLNHKADGRKRHQEKSGGTDNSTNTPRFKYGK